MNIPDRSILQIAAIIMLIRIVHLIQGIGGLALRSYWGRVVKDVVFDLLILLIAIAIIVNAIPARLKRRHLFFLVLVEIGASF